jgi:putative SOS response-associated peptidase YedK
MCGRYLVITEQEILEMRTVLEEMNENFRTSSDSWQATENREVFPGQVVPVIVSEGKSLLLQTMKWGFSRWDGKGCVINARAETVPEKPFFRDSYLSRRCVIPSGGFFEWKHSESANRRQSHSEKYLIQRKESSIFLMVGIWRSGEDQSEFTIITMPAADSIHNIHDRMPLFIDIRQIAPWLQSKISLAEIFTESKTKELFVSSRV